MIFGTLRTARRLLLSISFALAGVSSGVPELSLDKASYQPGEAISASFAGGPGSSKDWIGIYPSGIVPSGNPVSLLWFYTNGTRATGGNLSSGTVTFGSPTLGIGSYDVYYLANDGYGVLAGPVTLTISNRTPSVWRMQSIRLRHAVAGSAYSGKISAFATPGAGRIFTKAEGPDWMNVSAAGLISGTPAAADAGIQTARIRMTDAVGAPATEVPLKLEIFPSGQEHVSRLKVMSYNVWKEWSQVRDGYQKGVDSILQADADIVCLQESSAAQAQTLADDLGWFRATSGNGSTQTVSRYPIVENFSAATAVGARIRITAAPVRDVAVLNCHLDYQFYGPYASRRVGASPQSVLTEEARSNRESQMTAILQAMNPRLGSADQIPVVMAGDFNTPSHLDWTAATASTHGSVGPVAWPVSTRIQTAGLTDSFRVAHPDPAAVPANSWSSIHKGSEAQDRIDFIHFKGKVLRVLSAEMFATAVETTVGAWGGDVTPVLGNTWPSDHFAMVTTFSIAATDVDGNDISDAWETQWFQSLGTDSLADPNADGLTNRTSMLLGLPPVGSSVQPVEITRDAGSPGNQLFFHISDFALGSGLRLQRSENLVDWTTIWSFDEDANFLSSMIHPVQMLAGSRWRLGLKELLPVTSNTKIFYRLSHF